jgi:hypothetical protein
VNEPAGQNSATNPNGYIDPDVFTDAAGANWLLFKSEGGNNANYPKVWVRKLSSSGLSFTASAAVALLTRNANPPGGAGNWEGTLVENPSMVRYGGKYVLFYSANEWSTSSYATGYAVCAGPQGPCGRPVSTPLLKTGGATGYGPGGPDAYVDARGRLKVVFASWRCAGGSGSTCGDGAKNRRTFRQAWVEWSGGHLVVKKYGNSWGSGTDYVWTFDSTAKATGWSTNAGGTYTPVSGDFKGDSRDEIYWYATGGTDYLASFGAGMAMSNTALGQSGRYLPVSGDFNGDGDTDVYWYAPGNRALEGHPQVQPEDVFWISDGSTMNAQVVVRAQDGFGYPVAGDFTGDGTDDIFWVTPGGTTESLWELDADASGVTVNVVPKSNTVARDSAPLVGDFDGDGIDDIFWYGFGALPDQIWDFDATAKATVIATDVTGEYRPFSGDFDGDGFGDIFWYRPGSGTDYLWRFDTGFARSSSTRTVGGWYTPVVGDYDGNGVDDIYWYA